MTFRAFGIFTFAALVTACSALPAAAADKETRQMMADIRMLQEQSQQLQGLIGQLTDALKSLDTRLSARIDDNTNATRKSLADQKLVVDSVSTELRVLREKVDDNNVRVGSLTQEVDALRQLVTQLGTARTPSSPSDDSAAAPGDATGAGGSPVLGASPKQAFDQAMTDYYGGNYGLAIQGFQAYIASFPRAEQAPDAQLNIGNSYLNDGKYQQAVDAYDSTIRSYPANTKVLPEAYYKKGVALQALGRLGEARDAFETVTKTYAGTPEAGLASQRLPEMTSPAAPKR